MFLVNKLVVKIKFDLKIFFYISTYYDIIVENHNK